HQPQQTQYQKDGADDAADHSRLGGATPHGVHLASINTRQVTLAHHPGKRPENGADNQTENTQHEDERSAMRRKAWLLIHVFTPSINYKNCIVDQGWSRLGKEHQPALTKASRHSQRTAGKCQRNLYGRVNTNSASPPGKSCNVWLVVWPLWLSVTS